jgi:ComF family protein
MAAGCDRMGLLARWATSAWAACREAVFPARCLECGQFLAPASGDVLPAAPAAADALRLLGPHFCPGCLQGVLRVGHPLCPGCGVMFKGGVGEDHVCGRCLETPPPFHMARAAFVYDRSLVDVIHCFKYKGKTQLARPLGVLLFEAFERYWGRAPVDVVLPVPLHRRRLKERGFNQALLLVRRWPLRPGMPKVPVDTDVLRRARATAPQAGLGRRGRQANIAGAFALRHPERVAGRHILLVDDVITTGATAGECARLLLDNGAARVDVLALARVI